MVFNPLRQQTFAHRPHKAHWTHRPHPAVLLGYWIFRLILFPIAVPFCLLLLICRSAGAKNYICVLYAINIPCRRHWIFVYCFCVYSAFCISFVSWIFPALRDPALRDGILDIPPRLLKLGHWIFRVGYWILSFILVLGP